jgi:hypothetical protein
MQQLIQQQQQQQQQHHHHPPPLGVGSSSAAAGLLTVPLSYPFNLPSFVPTVGLNVLPQSA